MFNADFYPTPNEVIQTMISGLDLQGKRVLEPSAGKGNIVDVLNQYGAEVFTFEKNEDLAHIVRQKSNFLGFDFLDCTPDMVSHVDYIIMNPPFSQDEKHILHAWDVAPEGCEIISLCNSETIKNQFSTYRKRLGTIIKDYGDVSIELEDCFNTAERKTNVHVTLVKLFKPIVSDDFDYEGFFLEEEPEYTQEGVIQYSEIRSVVSRYIASVKAFEQVEAMAKEIEGLVAPIGITCNYNDGLAFNMGREKTIKTKADFAKEIQKKSWQWIFDKVGIKKYVTSGVMKDINKFVETQSKYPFTMKNIFRMIDIIIQTRSQTMDRALIEVFDDLTQRYHQNRYALEGWKTNSHYLINQKFILPYVFDVDIYNDTQKITIKYGSNVDRIDDLHKALCFLTGQHKALKGMKMDLERSLETNTWYDWGFFEVKGFKKGTLHAKFKDLKVWELFNQRIAELKGFPLPESIL